MQHPTSRRRRRKTTATAASEPPLPKAPSGQGYFRWVICTLLLFGTTKNYMDRNVLGVLNKTLQHDLGLERN